MEGCDYYFKFARRKVNVVAVVVKYSFEGHSRLRCMKYVMSDFRCFICVILCLQHVCANRHCLVRFLVRSFTATMCSQESLPSAQPWTGQTHPLISCCTLAEKIRGSKFFLLSAESQSQKRMKSLPLPYYLARSLSPRCIGDKIAREKSFGLSPLS